MNLKEGLRRFGLVLTASIVLMASVGYGVISKPTLDEIAAPYKVRLVTMLYEEQTQDFKKSMPEYKMEAEIWPYKSAEYIIGRLCDQPSSKAPAVGETCKKYADEVKYFWWQWVKHIVLTILFSAMAGGLFALLWSAFSWVLLGFTLPKDHQPK